MHKPDYIFVLLITNNSFQQITPYILEIIATGIVLYCTVPFTVRVMAPKSINNHVIGLIQHDILAFICDNTWVRRHRHKFGSSNGLLDNYNYKRVRRKIQNKTVYVNTLPFKGPRTFNVLRNIWLSDTPIKISPRLLED